MRRHHVRVQPERDAHVRMPESLGDHLRADTLADHPRRCGMTQAVHADERQPEPRSQGKGRRCSTSMNAQREASKSDLNESALHRSVAPSTADRTVASNRSPADVSARALTARCSTCAAATNPGSTCSTRPSRFVMSTCADEATRGAPLRTRIGQPPGRTDVTRTEVSRSSPSSALADTSTSNSGESTQTTGMASSSA